MVAEKIGIDYEVMIGLDKKTKATPKSSDPIPIDEALQILNQALEETGITINKKQKQAVLKIIREELEKEEKKIREELKKAGDKTRSDIKKYLRVFGG